MPSLSDRPGRLLFVTAALLLAGTATPHPLHAQDADRLEAAVGTAANGGVGLEWRELGPTIVGGRVSDLAAVESDPSTFYVGTASAGVWKTVNGGTTFEEVFRDESTASIGDVTVAPSNPNVVWVGTGEPQNRQSSPWGDGVYRSLDGGRTWSHMGLEATHHISRIRIDPRDPDVVYVAAVGHLWGANPERGVYRTTDGGETWEKVLYVDENTGVIDLAMDPGDPRTLFAATYQRRRTPWGFNGGGPGSGIWRTLDGGETWEEMTEGLPEGDKGRIGLDVYRRDGNVVYAIVEADARGGGGGSGSRENGVYRSTDRGRTWEHMGTTNNRPMYYSQIRVDPNDPERLFAGGSSLYRSEDAGRSFDNEAARDVHPDHHALWIDPADSDHLILGGDGGVSISWDGSATWRQLMNLPIAQFYEIGVDSQDPYQVCGGLQDNGSWCAPSDTWSSQGIRTRDWYNVGGGDGFFTVHHPGEPIMFAESQGGNLMRVNLRTMETIRMRPSERPLEDDEDRDLRWNWDTPVLLSSHDPGTVYIGSNVLFRSRDLGMSWEEISPDLTRNLDREELPIMGVPGDAAMMSKHDGQASYGNLTALAESPLNPGVLYTGSDDGVVHVSRDGGASWTDVTGNISGLPEHGGAHPYVTRIVASHGAEGTVWAAFDGHRQDDFSPYVYRSDDFGRSWERTVDGLPGDQPLNALAQHPRRADLLFAGNEVGVWFSVDGGERWVHLDNGLPTVPVDDIEIHPRENDLVLGTHGRGIWIMDDITPLEYLTADVLASGAHLFPVRRATVYQPYRPQEWSPGVWEAPNPPAGARIRYYFRSGAGVMAEDENGNGDGPRASAEDSVAIRILGPDGETVRELRGAAEAGINEVIWDLRIEPPYEVEVSDGDGGFFRGGPAGPRVLPGTYTAVLEAPGVTLETEVPVRLDPRVEVSRAELMARQDAIMDAYRLAKPAYEAGEAVDRLTEQLREVQGLLRRSESAPGELEDEVDALLEELDELDDEVGEVRGAGFFMRALESSHTRPTADQLWQIDRAWEDLPGLVRRINTLVTERVPALYRRLDEHGVRPDPGEPLEVPTRGGGGV